MRVIPWYIVRAVSPERMRCSVHCGAWGVQRRRWKAGGVSQTRRWLYSWLESALTRAGRVSCRVRGCARPIPRGPMPLVACISWLVLPSNAAERARNDALQSMLRHVVTDTCSFYSTLHDACNSRVRCGSFVCVCARSMTHVRAWGVCRHFLICTVHGAWCMDHTQSPK